MIGKIIARAKYYMCPPKPESVFWTDSFGLIAGKNYEHILHGLRDINGEAVWEPIYGKDTCRITIISDVMPYYILKQEILAVKVGTNDKEWKERRQNRRIWKHVFTDMIVEGNIRSE